MSSSLEKDKPKKHLPARLSHRNRSIETSTFNHGSSTRHKVARVARSLLTVCSGSSEIRYANAVTPTLRRSSICTASEPASQAWTPARAESDPLSQCRVIESALAEATTQLSGSRADRFFAHIQPYEFEALLFSDVSAFGSIQADWGRYVNDLRIARDSVETPEHINDGPTTHPSVRLTTVLHPKYIKPLHGSRIAISIGLARIREQCRHFDRWLTRIESLKPLR